MCECLLEDPSQVDMSLIISTTYILPSEAKTETEPQRRNWEEEEI